MGGLVRYGLAGWVAVRFGERFPLGTLVVNVTGAFLIGVAAFLPWAEMTSSAVVPGVRSFLMTGLLGGFTTVSSFSLQTFQLLHEGERQKAALNVISSLVCCLTAVTVGAALAVSLVEG